ncbi:MAG: aldolase [Coriobacteriales bacterium]|nr:aldolase [Coriobacteriales bacterium]
MPKLTRDQVRVPADVPAEARETYIDNYLAATRNTGRLMLYAADQKIEHLNDDFYGENIAPEDADPEHLFRIADQGLCGVFAGQRGLIARYARDYPDVNYLVKMNSKSHLVGTKQEDPYSAQLYDISAVADLVANGVNAVGIGYTIYLGSEYESSMLAEAGQLIADAHNLGLVVVLWMYPRGKAVDNEKDAHLIAGAAGVATILGSDFVKVNPPKGSDAASSAELLKEAAMACGSLPYGGETGNVPARGTGLVCAGGSTVDAKTFLTQLWEQIHVGGAIGNATGRNIHQRPLDEAVRLTKAISAITLDDYDADRALAIFEGREDYACGV